MGLKNPIGQATREYHHYLDKPETAARIADLERELELERSKGPAIEVREVEKVVVKEDKDLLDRYNSAMRELGALKRDLAKGRAHPAAIASVKAEAVATFKAERAAEIEIREVERVSHVVHVKRELNRRLLVMCVAAALVLGVILGAGISKALEAIPAPRAADPVKTEQHFKRAPHRGGVPHGGVK